MKYKPFLLGAVLGLLIFGLGVGLLVAKNWAEMPTVFSDFKIFWSRIEKTATPSLWRDRSLAFSATPSTSRSEESGCEMQTFTLIGVSGCLPDGWKVTDEEGPQGVTLGEVILQSPDYKVLIDQGNDGTPAIRIKSGYQLAIMASRLTADSNKATMAGLKAFWESNRISHATARQEERVVGGQPSLYHFLSTPKEGGQIDTHVIKLPLLYDINFFFGDGQNGKGENLYREILGRLSFEAIDPKMEENSDKIVVNTPMGPVSAGQPVNITISKDPSLEISSQAELPVVVRRSKMSGAKAVLGVARPQGEGVDQASYALTWAAPEVGDYEIVAQVVKDDGMIYESAGVGVTVVSKAASPLVRPG